MRPLWTHIPLRWRWPDTIPSFRREMLGEKRLRSYLMMPVRLYGRERWFRECRRNGYDPLHGRNRKEIREERARLRRDGLVR